MTDAELIAMARLAQRDDRMSTGALYGDLADRIEELDRACSEWADASQANYQRAKKAEAKLAKALESLQGLLWAWNELCVEVTDVGTKAHVRCESIFWQRGDKT